MHSNRKNSTYLNSSSSMTIIVKIIIRIVSADTTSHTVSVFIFKHHIMADKYSTLYAADVMESLHIPRGVRRVLFRTLNTDR